MTRDVSPLKVAVVGAGMAGATCARALSVSGCAVHVVDKSRGAGGRLATKTVQWLDPRGQCRTTRFDHGAPAFAAHSADFRQFLAFASPRQAPVPWTPTLAVGSRPLDDAGRLWLPMPDMPSLCRGLLRDIRTTWSFAVDRLRQGPLGWEIEAAGSTLPGYFDAVTPPCIAGVMRCRRPRAPSRCGNAGGTPPEALACAAISSAVTASKAPGSPRRP